MHPHMVIGGDKDGVKGKSLDRSTVRRILNLLRRGCAIETRAMHTASDVGSEGTTPWPQSQAPQGLQTDAA